MGFEMERDLLSLFLSLSLFFGFANLVPGWDSKPLLLYFSMRSLISLPVFKTVLSKIEPMLESRDCRLFLTLSKLLIASSDIAILN